jgi:hypothetical protein
LWSEILDCAIVLFYDEAVMRDRYLRKYLSVFGFALIATIIWYAAQRSGPTTMSTIVYQGQSIKLSKSYDHYDDYKNDPNNIAPGEVEKVQQLVLSAPIATHFDTRKQMTDALFEIAFPGYGMGFFSDAQQPDGSILALVSIEVPKSGNSRYLLFRGRSGAYTLIDDFVYADAAAIGKVSADGNRLVYLSREGAAVVKRAVASR